MLFLSLSDHEWRRLVDYEVQLNAHMWSPFDETDLRVQFYEVLSKPFGSFKVL